MLRLAGLYISGVYCLAMGHKRAELWFAVITIAFLPTWSEAFQPPGVGVQPYSQTYLVGNVHRGRLRPSSPIAPTRSCPERVPRSSWIRRPQSVQPRAVFGLQPEVAQASLGAVARLISVCSLGVLAAWRQVLDPPAISALSRLIFSVFQPALLFTNVASTLASPDGFGRSLAILPVFAVLQIFIGSIFGQGLARLARLDPASDEGKEVAICSSFANSGPLPLLFADALFRSHPDPTLLPRAVAYISFYLLSWSPMFWIYGRYILGGSPAPSPVSDVVKPGVVARAKALLKHPMTARILSPPTLGCVLGALVGGIPFTRRLVIGKSAPLGPLFDALRTLGAAYLPTVLLVLSGSLAQGIKSFRIGMLRRVGIIMIARFLLMPITALGLVLAGTSLGWIPTLQADALLIFILLMEAAMPSAQNTVVILQLEKRPEAAASMARTVSIMYVLSVLPITALLSAILHYVRP